MSSEDAIASTLASIAICGLLGLCTHFGCEAGRNEKNEAWKNWAVDTGRAEFYLDDKHERQWRWKEVQ